ncbi:two-component system response regulator CreB [Piscinibacter sp.]|uniref:two-component system response regulator CreB n=1 Tax=Piscinibacter sp. TaxID=1903157 RepID=UPI0039E6AF63
MTAPRPSGTTVDPPGGCGPAWERPGARPGSRPTILIVEDEPGIADTLQYALATDGFEPLWVASGEAALARLREAGVALVILDVGLPDLNGFEVFRRLRGFSEVPVLFLTARADEIDRVVGLELGADDYVAKPFSPRELVARIRGILRRAAKATAPAAPSTPPLPFQVDEGRRTIRFYGRPLELSRYEYGLLKTLVEHPGHVFSRDVLLDKVWDTRSESLDRTVDAHVKTLRAKLKAVAPTLEAIRTHRGSGYALAEDLPAAPP